MASYLHPHMRLILESQFMLLRAIEAEPVPNLPRSIRHGAGDVADAINTALRADVSKPKPSDLEPGAAVAVEHPRMFTFDDASFGTSMNGGRTLGVRIVSRPTSMTLHEWYDFCGTLAAWLNRFGVEKEERKPRCRHGFGPDRPCPHCGPQGL